VNNLNSLLIEGNLVKDSESNTTAKGVLYCTFSIASNRFFKQDEKMQKEVSYFDVKAWSQVAENCRNHGRKGRGVRVVGRLKQERWTGSDNKSHSRIVILAEHVDFRPEFKHDYASEQEKPDDTASFDEDEAVEIGFAAHREI
jgi:single-strand DNA-binding protein